MSYDPRLRAAVVEIIQDAIASGYNAHNVAYISAENFLKKRKKQHLKQFFKMLREGETK